MLQTTEADFERVESGFTIKVSRLSNIYEF